MSELPPDWAIERVLSEGYRGSGWTPEDVKTYGQATPLIQTIMSFARYIASKEDAPTDPLLQEARSIAASDYRDNSCFSTADEIMAGYYDDCAEVRTVLNALRRGMELAKEQA